MYYVNHTAVKHCHSLKIRYFEGIKNVVSETFVKITSQI